MTNALTLKRRYLEHLLAEDPGSIGLTLDIGGWALTDDIVARGFGRLSFSDIAQIVALSEGRLEQSRDAARVRATAGHTFPVDLSLVPGYPPDRLYAALPPDDLAATLERGLSRSGRSYVRLVEGKEDAAAQASTAAAVILEVDVAKMLGLGLAFLHRDGAEWLVESVPPTALKALP